MKTKQLILLAIILNVSAGLYAMDEKTAETPTRDELLARLKKKTSKLKKQRTKSNDVLKYCGKKGIANVNPNAYMLQLNDEELRDFYLKNQLEIKGHPIDMRNKETIQALALKTARI